MRISWVLIVAVSTFLIAVVNGDALIRDGDPFWHLASGRWMIENQQPILVDLFSHSMRGASWVSHEWLSSIVMQIAYLLGGWTGLVILFSAVLALTAAQIAKFLFDELEPAYALLLTLFALGSISAHLMARPHSLVMPIMVFCVIDLVQSMRMSRTPHWIFFILLCLWANLHGSFVLGLGLIVFFMAETVWLAGSAGDRIKQLKKWGICLLLGLVACTATPHGFAGLLFPFQLTQMEGLLSYIGEWQSPNFHHLTFQELWIVSLLMLGFLTKFQMSFLRSVLVIFLIHLSLKHFRHVGLLGAILPILIASPLAKTISAMRVDNKHSSKLDGFFDHFKSPANLGGVMASMVITVVLTFIYLLIAGPMTPRQSIAPFAAVAAAKKMELQGNVFNSYTFGGYLIFMDIAPFIDGRADMYGGDFVKKAVEAHNAVPGKLEPLLSEYQIQWTMLMPTAPAVALLDQSANWQRVYTDDYAIIHRRLP